MQRKNRIFLFKTLACIVFILNIACSKKSIQKNPDLIEKKSKIENKIEIPSMPIFLQKMTEKDTLVDGLGILFSFTRTACFGFCPTFEFKLYTNGVACFEGKQFAKIEGKLFGLLTELQWNELKTKASQINFNQLEERYPIDKREEIPDLPLVITGINYTGQYKMVTHSHSAPTELKEYETFIQGMIDEFIEKNAIKKD